MRSSSRKASDRSVTSPLDYDLRRLHPFGESVQMWVAGVSGKKDQKLHLQATCTYPGRRNLHERLGHEPGSGETADDAGGDT